MVKMPWRPIRKSSALHCFKHNRPCTKISSRRALNRWIGWRKSTLLKIKTSTEAFEASPTRRTRIRTVMVFPTDGNIVTQLSAWTISQRKTTGLPTRLIRGTSITTVITTVGTTGQVSTSQLLKGPGMNASSRLQAWWFRTVWATSRSRTSWNTITKPVRTSTTAMRTAGRTSPRWSTGRLYLTSPITITPMVERCSSTAQTQAITTPTATCCPIGTSTRWPGTRTTTTSVRTSTFVWCGLMLRRVALAIRTRILVFPCRRTVQVEPSPARTQNSRGSPLTRLTRTTPTSTPTRMETGTVQG